MNLWQNVSPAEPLPFSLSLEKAAKNVGGGVPAVSTPACGILRTAGGYISSGWRWLQRTRVAQGATRRLRVTETISLGEKRFLSIVQVDDTQFLIGTSATQIQLLAHLAQPTGEVGRRGAQEIV